MDHIKRIPKVLNVSDFKVCFSYETRKGYYRQQERLVASANKEDAKTDFNIWSKTQRTMANVKILGIVEVENSRKSIEL